jgi:hypothetical protein
MFSAFFFVGLKPTQIWPSLSFPKAKQIVIIQTCSDKKFGMISDKALLRKKPYNSKCVIRVEMKVHLHLADNIVLYKF